MTHLPGQGWLFPGRTGSSRAAPGSFTFFSDFCPFQFFLPVINYSSYYLYGLSTINSFTAP
ncbi:MAG TPA: hypothetical protein DCP64_07430 [Sarcina sp.]|nr:hypothetical protein SAMN04487833_10354 [Sarcina sp. DSM 11001]HAL59236.1 hypothetical protein [Sarcina sp.]